jgi:hypothetical protein
MLKTCGLIFCSFDIVFSLLEFARSQANPQPSISHNFHSAYILKGENRSILSDDGHSGHEFGGAIPET